MKQVPVGSTVRVTGICSLDRGDFYQGFLPFEVLLRTPEDVVETASPSLLNVRNLVRLVVVLLIIVLGVGARGWLIERRLRNRAAHMVKVEKMRSAILARINRAHPLHEVLGQITQLVSLALPESTCWCAMESGEQIGALPMEDDGGRRLVEKRIAARSGPPYGVLRAAFPATSKPSLNEAGALSTAAELATVAIETNRTHTDLVRRSEFDLLTGLHNRFALEKRLEAFAENRRAEDGLRAIIYLDLDDFKQVNDTYGHHMGDLYLREIAKRMKHQIRPADMLARLGGDEFAVAISGARTRTDVDEIGARLKSCFDRPFELDGQRLRGSASFGIAYWPDDSSTTEGLLKAADAAMYERKRARREAATQRS
jgi:diguanylate cyclase (GGDEF)-like protein